MIETKVFVGLNDQDTMKQKFETDRYLNVLRNICKNYGVAFSFTTAEGGYIHDNGEYTQENSIIITLIDTDKKVIDEICKDLCVFFHQESVLVTETEIQSYFVREHVG